MRGYATIYSALSILDILPQRENIVFEKKTPQVTLGVPYLYEKRSRCCVLQEGLRVVYVVYFLQSAPYLHENRRYVTRRAVYLLCVSRVWLQAS